jgi:hypothetical protein
MFSLSNIRKVVFSLLFASLISLSLLMLGQPSQAANQLTTSDSAEIQQREQAYEQAKDIAEDPKMGIEKEYEKEVEAYREEHAGEGGIVEKTKELVTEVTSK